MSKETDYEIGTVTVYCDKCNANEAVDGEFGKAPSYKEAGAHVRELGWSVANDNGSWSDFCPDCTEARRRYR